MLDRKLGFYANRLSIYSISEVQKSASRSTCQDVFNMMFSNLIMRLSLSRGLIRTTPNVRAIHTKHHLAVGPPNPFKGIDTVGKLPNIKAVGAKYHLATGLLISLRGSIVNIANLKAIITEHHPATAPLSP